MGELGTIRRYSYWSDRRIRSIADDNNISLDRRWKLGLKSPTFGLLPQAEVTQERRALQRHAIASKIEDAIGQLAVEDFVTPPPARFAKGIGEITFAAYTRWGLTEEGKKPQGKGVIIHTRVRGSDGSKVEICLFGSIDNCAGYLGGSNADAPIWQSSSTWAIEEFIKSRGTEDAPIYDDDESIAVEIVRTINNEGMASKHVFNHSPTAEWFAEVYNDVKLDKDQWNLEPGSDMPDPPDRIVIGAPLWVRSNDS